ncbi:hypothetical protein HPB50_013158 [Hyalomma asiaticum]|uniref:Uncharacterized protein n=1 Tax=Hyalomma asiaticum TaxID=266040 RepID=A0ACB7SW28_HYAAI|nr:hypothetical protein HPB50_013158 [Hyalomma asiaticum]
MLASQSTQRITSVGGEPAIDPEDGAVVTSVWLPSKTQPTMGVLPSSLTKSSHRRDLMRSSSCVWLAIFVFLTATAVSAMLAWKSLNNSTTNIEGNPNDADSSNAFLISVFNDSRLQALSTSVTAGVRASRRRSQTSSTLPKEMDVSDNSSERLPKNHWKGEIHFRSNTTVPEAPEYRNMSRSNSISTLRRIFSTHPFTTISPDDGVSLDSDSTCTDKEPSLKKTAVNKAEAVSATHSRDIIIANTSKGSIIGRKRKLRGKDVAVFLGIPYGANTGSSNRFSAPQPFGHWNTALDASKPRAPCYQWKQPSVDRREDSNSHASPSPSEDCLHVNVWAPMCNNSYCSGLTVLVFIHGGGLRSGGNADRLHEGSVLAAQGQVIVVVPNYRLGVFGFPSRDIVGAARNPGLLDIAMALDWVKDSVAAFGGNAKNVVLFGSGWGSYLAGLFLVSPKLRSYFGTFRIILGSGSPLLKSSHEHQAEEHWNGFLGAAGCGDVDENTTLECLRNATASSLSAAQLQFPGSVGVLFPDDFVLPEPPAEFVAEVRTYSPAEVLLTNVVSEGRAEYQRLFENKSDGADLSIESLMNAVGLTASQLAYDNHVELQAAVSSLYKKYGTNRGGVGAEFLGDVLYNCPSVLFAKRLCSGRAHVLLLAARRMPSATHGDDIPLVFGAPIASSIRDGTAPSTTGADVAYSQRVISIWTGFARNGFKALSSDFPAFCDPETNDTSSVMFHDHSIRIGGWKQRQCAFLNRYMMYYTTMNKLGPLASLQRHVTASNAVTAQHRSRSA